LVQSLQRLGHVGERRPVAQGSRLPEQQRDVVLPVVARLAGIAQPVMASDDLVARGNSHRARVQPGADKCPTSSHGTEQRLRATDTRLVLDTLAGFST
jgi:hypothetical protein